MRQGVDIYTGVGGNLICRPVKGGGQMILGMSKKGEQTFFDPWKGGVVKNLKDKKGALQKNRDTERRTFIFLCLI